MKNAMPLRSASKRKDSTVLHNEFSSDGSCCAPIVYNANVTVADMQMLNGKILIGLLLALSFAPRAAFALDCKEPDAGTDKAAMFSPPLAETVTGVGRLQFYSAPDLNCAMTGVFVIPKDELIAYAETDDGWTSVMYTNPRTNNVVNGWVKSARLKAAGTVGPGR